MRSFFFVLLTVNVWTTVAFGQVSKELLLRHVDVIDIDKGKILKDRFVRIKGNTIVETGSDKIKNTEGIDLTGLFLMPGLWDMHTHIIDAESFFPALLSKGILYVRDMGGNPAQLKQWKNQIDNGELVGPRLFFSGPLLDGPQPMWPIGLGISGTEEVNEKLSSLKPTVDFFKVYSLLPRATYYEISRWTKENRMIFAGHLPLGVTLREASIAGQKSIEHLDGLLLALSDKEVFIQEQIKKIIDQEGITPQSYQKGRREIVEGTEERFSKKKLQEISKLLLKNDTYLCPTLWFQRSISDRLKESQLKDSETLPGYLLNLWNSQKKRLETNSGSYFTKNLNLASYVVLKLHRKGVKILAGSDTPNPNMVPGQSLIEELKQFKSHGIEEKDLLRIAVSNPSNFFNLDNVGKIKKGYEARMIILSTDPMKDIDHLDSVQKLIIGTQIIEIK